MAEINNFKVRTYSQMLEDALLEKNCTYWIDEENQIDSYEWLFRLSARFRSHIASVDDMPSMNLMEGSVDIQAYKKGFDLGYRSYETNFKLDLRQYVPFLDIFIGEG